MTQDEIMEMAQECRLIGSDPRLYGIYMDALLSFAKLVAEAEREACAKLCENLVLSHPGRADLTADQCAAAIRARGQA